MALALKGKLTVNVIEAQELRNTELIGKMDPYVKIQLGNEKFKTKVHKDGHKNPKWNQSFLFNLEGKEDIVHILVMEKETFSDDTIGRADIQLRDFVSVRDTPRWFQLVEKDNFRKMAGKILLSVHFEGSGLPAENKAVSIPVQASPAKSPSASPPAYNPSSAPPPAYNPSSAPPPAYNPMAPSASPVLPPPTMVQSPPMYVPPSQPVMQPVMQQPVFQPQQQIYTQPPIQQQYQQYPPQQVTFQSPQPIVYTQPVFQSPTVFTSSSMLGMPGMHGGMHGMHHHHHHDHHGGHHGGSPFGGHHGGSVFGGHHGGSHFSGHFDHH